MSHRPGIDGNQDQPSGACASTRQLLAFAREEFDNLPVSPRKHIESCPRCAFDLVVFRAASCLAELPCRWTVHLGNQLRGWLTEIALDCRQLFGHVSFETRDFCVCDEKAWTYSPMALRVNLVLDITTEFFSLSILDCPAAIDGVALMTATGLRYFRYDAESTSFDFSLYEQREDVEDASVLTFAEVQLLLRAHKLQLIIDMKDGDESSDSSIQSNDVLDLLEQHQAIERNADYVLPCGLHSNTFVNVAAICSREESMQLIAAKFDFLFWDTHFDTIVACGWAMSLIGRRLAAARHAQGSRVPIRQVLCEGYADPVLLDDITPGSRVLVLIDVTISGQLARRVERIVQAAGSDVVAVAVLVQSHATPTATKTRSLCEVEMELTDTRQAVCPRCGILPEQVFNPVAGCMTTKSASARSPSEFLKEDQSAQELWKFADAAMAYEHHRKEGDTHYIGFIDTRKLLESREIGSVLVTKLIDVLVKSGNEPSVLLVPQRTRARLLAVKMSRVIAGLGGIRPRILYAVRKRTSGQWELQNEDLLGLHDDRVLIVDTAAGHGRTIDQLAILADRHRAKRVGAAVLLSRLTPPCEEAFHLRLSGGYHRLYNLPIRPVAIRGERVDLCPICRRKDAIRRFADGADIEALEKWADSLLKSRRGSMNRVARPKDKQLSLFEFDESFFSACGAAIASGVTLHALGAATANGSAPLTLPELLDERIPWRVRANMVENLPSGILEWTGTTLANDLLNVLSAADYPSIWKATANLLAREGNDVWLDYLGMMLGRLHEHHQKASPSFWNQMACNTFLVAAESNDTRLELQMRIEQLLSVHDDVAIQSGLRQMHEVISH